MTFEQADSILVQVRFGIRPISGIQNINCAVWNMYVLYRVRSSTVCNDLSNDVLEELILFLSKLKLSVVVHGTLNLVCEKY